MRWVINIVALLLPVAGALPDDARITSFRLDERLVFRIPVAQNRVTTIRFPSPLTAIDGAGITTDAKTPGLFQLAYRPPNAFFSVRALAKDASANLNVVCDRKLYALELVESKEPLYAVTFTDPPSAPARTIPAAGGQAASLTVSRLLGLLQKAKAYPLLQQHHPQALAGSRQVRPNLTNEYDNFWVVIEEVTRFDADDALVFRLLLASRTGQDIRYKPDSFAVRIADHVYYQAVSDADGVIPAHGQARAYFALVGTPDGRRAALSPDNDFIVLVAPLPSQQLSVP